MQNILCSRALIGVLAAASLATGCFGRVGIYGGGGLGNLAANVLIDAIIIAALTPPPAVNYEAAYYGENPGNVWINGRNTWNGSAWVWTPGYWQAEQPGQVYVQGYYETVNGGYVWHNGAWVAQRPGYVYTGGSWVAQGNGYAWSQGTWVAEQPGQHWRNGRWVDEGGQRRWHDGHWEQ